MLREVRWTRSVTLGWIPSSTNRSPFFLGFRPMAQRAESPPRNVRLSSASSSLRSVHTRHDNLLQLRLLRGDKRLCVHHRCRAQAAITRRPRASCRLGTRVTTSSLSFGECLSICRPPIRILTGSRWTGFLLMNVGELGNFISYAFAPASVVAPLGTVSGRSARSSTVLIRV